MARRSRKLGCEACGAGAEAGILVSCEDCRRPLHEDCLRYGGCPECSVTQLESSLEPVQEARAGLRARRVAASAADVGVLLAPAMAVFHFTLLGLGLPIWAVFVSSVAAAIAMDVVNIGLFMGEGGATLGKRLLGLRVVDRTGRPLGWKRAMQREFLFKTMSTLALGLGFVGALGPEARTWHDRVSESRVVPEGPAGELLLLEA